MDLNVDLGGVGDQTVLSMALRSRYESDGIKLLIDSGAQITARCFSEVTSDENLLQLSSATGSQAMSQIPATILKSLLVKLGESKEQDQIIKAYKTPYSKKYKGSATSPSSSEEGQGGADLEKDKKRFARRKSC